MKASKEHVKTAIQIYVDRELMNKGTPEQKFITFFGASFLIARLDKAWQSFMSNAAVSALGVVDSAGMVEVDDLIAAANAAMERFGQVTFAGLTFNRNDIDAFQRYMQEAMSYG